MATTTQDAVYRGILTDLAAAAGSIGINSNYMFVSPFARFVQLDDKYLQLIPGVPVVETSDSGIGLVTEDFKIVVWLRLYLDQIGDSTEKITNDTLGIMDTMGDIRQALIQGDANETVTIPIVWTEGGVPSEDADHPGWVYYEDSYRMGWEIVWT